MTIGMLRIRNEARWIERSITSILPVCDRVLVLDDHSSDGTPFLCASMPRVEVFDSPFSGCDEVRDKNYLLDKVRIHKPDWVLAIDGDEEIRDGYSRLVLASHAQPSSQQRCFMLPVWFLWDTEQQRRVDGVYRHFWRDSLFRPGEHRFEPTTGTANFHCGNAPASVRGGSARLNAPLLHFGYLHQADRLRKYEWYNRVDPGNLLEDEYKHVVVGDVFPAESRFKHGGPLKLEAV